MTNKQRTKAQQNSAELYYKETANWCVEHGITHKVLLEMITLEVYPTQESIKNIIRAIASTKFLKGKTSTLTQSEHSQVIQEFERIMLEGTMGEFDIKYPSQENTEEYLNSFNV